RNRRQQDAPGGGKGHAPRRQRWQRDDRRVSRGDELRQRRRECLHQRDGRHQSVLGGSAGNDSIWTAAGDTIHGGSNNATIGGVAGVTMVGGNGGNQFLDASQGHQSVLGGSGGNETIWGAATDTIRGGSETIGGTAGETIFGGSGANVFVAAMNGNMSVVGGTAGSMTVWSGPGDTIRGGSDNE